MLNYSRICRDYQEITLKRFSSKSLLRIISGSIGFCNNGFESANLFQILNKIGQTGQSNLDLFSMK